MFASGRRVIASLAPSFVAQFPGVRAGQLIRALKNLGFFAVSETALGAQKCFSQRARTDAAGAGAYLDFLCMPGRGGLCRKVSSECESNISALLSPLLTHCKMLRAHYGDAIAIVFIGPCIAKKQEAEQHPELLDVVLTFEDIQNWLDEETIDLSKLVDTEDDRFALQEAREGSLYPIEGA